MALPLLAALGLGMAGGIGFLEKKSDERKAESMLRNFEPQFGGLDAGERNARWQRDVDELMESDVGFFNSKADMAASMLDRYESEIQADQARIQQGIENQAALNQNAVTDLRAQMEGAASRFDAAQSNLRKAESILERASREKSFANIDMQEFVWLVADSREPGRAKTKDEIEGIIATNPLLSRVWLDLNVGGKADPESVRAMYRLLRENFAEEQRQYDEAVSARDRLERAYYDQGMTADERQYRGLWGVTPGYAPREYGEIMNASHGKQVGDEGSKPGREIVEVL